MLEDLGREFEVIVCDCHGIEEGRDPGDVLRRRPATVVTSRGLLGADSDRMIGILSSKSRRAEQNLEGIRGVPAGHPLFAGAGAAR